jgi:hypothetical protein
MLNDGDDSGAPQRGRPPSVALRQPSAPLVERLTRSDSWWMTVKPSESMTARAEAERARMATSREWTQVSSNQVFGLPTI